MNLPSGPHMSGIEVLLEYEHSPPEVILHMVTTRGVTQVNVTLSSGHVSPSDGAVNG